MCQTISSANMVLVAAHLYGGGGGDDDADAHTQIIQ
jgi:hypothetical protein